MKRSGRLRPVINDHRLSAYNPLSLEVKTTTVISFGKQAFQIHIGFVGAGELLLQFSALCQLAYLTHGVELGASVKGIGHGGILAAS
jgi:hypothetical protein